MVVGVYHDRLVLPFAEVLRNLGVRNGFVVHSGDGLDEISSLAVTHAARLSPDGIRETVIDPKELLEDPALREGSLAGGDKAETIFEISDLAYHVMVLMVEMGIEPKDIFAQLASRHVVDHKVKQEKMQ